MLGIESRSMTIPRGRRRTEAAGRASLRRVSALAIVTAITVPVVFSARPVGASQVSTLQARAAAVSQALLHEQLQIGAYQAQVAQDTLKVHQDDLAIATARHKVAATQATVDQDVALLKRQALFIYMNFGTQAANSGAQLFSRSVLSGVVRQEYERVAAGDVQLTLDRLHHDTQVLTATEAALTARQAQDAAVRAQEAQMLHQSTVTAQLLSSQKATVTGQLAAAVAHQQALAAQAAAAAIAAADAARAGAANKPAAPGRAPPRSGGATTDPALNAYLQCVVRAESGGNYAAVSPGGVYMGAFQFSQATWNAAALLAGLPGLVGVAPNTASKADQDTLAVALYAADGTQPWVDGCS